MPTIQTNETDTRCPYHKIAFIGLGLIGGSIAKAIRSRHPKTLLYAMARDASMIRDAYDAGVIVNETPIELSDLSDMDVIFLCAPVRANIEYVKKLAAIVSPDTLITDVGSVKGQIASAIKKAGLSAQFIGGHPMTGSEQSGFSSADPLLLENAYYILCEDGTPARETVDDFHRFISSLGSVVMRLDAKEHDHAVAAISHLPHIIASGLVNTVDANDNDNHLMRTIAAGGFRDITRIASSSPVMWQSICLENRDEILDLMDRYEKTFDEMRNVVKSGDRFAIFDFFSRAKDYRDSLPIKKRGVLPEAFDFYMDIKDETGQIAKVATILADAGLNIKNIGIVHNREYEDGVLHIEMYDAKTREAATALLAKNGYKLYGR